MKNILITGGAGFIGANFVHFLLEKRPSLNLTVLDALTYAGNINNIRSAVERGKINFIRGSVCDSAGLEQVLETRQIDTVVHFAAESHVDRSITGPDEFINTNIVGTHTLLQAVKKCWQSSPDGFAGKLFHHVSTDEVYGTLGADDPAFAETTPYAPNSPYAASKAASDHLVRACHHTYGLPVTTSNCSNNYGPYQFPEKLLPLCLLNILAGKDLPIYGDGLQIRDWLHVDDHSRGIALILENGRLGETYNIGGNNERTNIETVKLLCEIVDSQCLESEVLVKRFPSCPAAKGKPATSLITYVKDRPGHDTRYAINAEKIMSELGYSPKVDFASGLTDTVSWYLKHEAWWQSVLNGSYQQDYHEDKTQAAS